MNRNIASIGTENQIQKIEPKDLPIRRNNKDVLIDGQILAIAASHIKPDSAGRQILKEAFDDRPRLIDKKMSQSRLSAADMQSE